MRIVIPGNQRLRPIRFDRRTNAVQHALFLAPPGEIFVFPNVTPLGKVSPDVTTYIGGWGVRLCQTISCFSVMSFSRVHQIRRNFDKPLTVSFIHFHAHFSSGEG